MLSKERRIPRELLKDLTSKDSPRPKYSNSTHFSLRAFPSPDGGARLAVSVSKKVAKKAVLRNRTRRRTYSAMRKLILSLRPGLFLISAKVGSDKLKGEVLENELKSLFAQGDFVVSGREKG